MKKLADIIIFAMTITLAAMMPASTQETTVTQYTKTVPASFEDIFTDLQDVVINKGLVIDFIGNVDDMLNRTSDVAESVTPSGQKSPYLHAKYIQFCSSKLTHRAVSADPQNLAICPYIIFLYETRANPGKVTIGYRPPIFGPSKRSRKIKLEVLEFLQAIIDQAISE